MDDHLLWQEQAFGKLKDKMKCTWTYLFERKKFLERDIKCLYFTVAIEH